MGLTAAAWVLHPQVLLVLAGVLVQLALVAVVLAVAAAHRLLRLALAAQRAHALGRQAVRRLHARAAVAAGHVGAGVLQGCRGTERRKNKFFFVPKGEEKPARLRVGKLLIEVAAASALLDARLSPS